MDFKEITPTEVFHEIVNLKQLTFEVTDACNLNCKYCGYGDFYNGYDERKSEFLDFGKVKMLLDYLCSIWTDNPTNHPRPVTYISFYGGEPLMNMKLIKQIIDYLETLGINREFRYSMTTNAVLLDRHIDFFVEKNISLLVSLDGDEQSHSYRVNHDGKNSFYHVFNNIKKLQIEHPDFFQSNVNFNAVLHNRSSVERVHSFIKTEFGKIPTISELNNSGVRPEKIKEFEATYRNKTESLSSSEHYHEMVEEMLMRNPQTHDLLIFLHRYSDNVFRNYSELFIDEAKLTSVPTGTCIPFSKKMFITVNGKILQCERIDHHFSLGEITNDGVSLNTEGIANFFNRYLNKLKKQCNGCYRKKSCIQCIYYIENIVDVAHPICKGFMNKEQFEIYTSNCLFHLKERPQLYKKLMTEVVVE